MDTELVRRGASEGTRATARYRLDGLTESVATGPLSALTPRRCASLYEAYAKTHKPTTHHNALKQAKAWGAWAVKQGQAKVNPWAGIQPIGRKAHGKKQLRLDDTAKLFDYCVSVAEVSDDACAVLIGLVLGLRASEIVGLTKTDLDAAGTLVWISKSKTQAGVRPVRLPEVLQVPLKIRSDRSKKETGWRLLPYSRWWVRAATHRVCRLARVPKITAHALRGGGATEALEAGESPEVVAKWLGQKGTDTLRRSYAQGGAGESAKAARRAEQLEALAKERSGKKEEE